MLNKVTLMGNLGQDVTIKQANGKNVATFSLATSESYKDQNGNKIDKTEWHNIVIWDKLADVAAKYLKKGSKIYLEGKIATQTYEKDGVKQYSTKIVAYEFKMLDSKPQGTEQPQSTPQKSQATPPPQVDSEVDDLPF